MKKVSLRTYKALGHSSQRPSAIPTGNLMKTLMKTLADCADRSCGSAEPFVGDARFVPRATAARQARLARCGAARQHDSAGSTRRHKAPRAEKRLE
jgi:hypothetical protein